MAFSWNSDAASLAGPYHLSGQFSGPAGAPVVFRLASEKRGPAGTPIRASVDAGPSWPAIQFDGALDASRPGAQGPSVIRLRDVSLGPAAPAAWPWRAAGRMTADLDRAAIEQAEFRVGPEERALHAEGSATLTYGVPVRLVVEAKAKQANLDALLRGKGEDVVPPARALGHACGCVLAGSCARRASCESRRSSSRATSSSAARRCPDVSGERAARSPARLSTCPFNLGLPGHSRLKGMGRLKTGAAARFDGTIDFRAEDLALLRQMVQPGRAGIRCKASQASARRLQTAAPRSRAVSKPPPRGSRDTI